MQAELIFWPMIVLATATLIIYPVMLYVRVRGVKSGKVRPSVYRLNDGEPEDSRKFNNAIRNQFESPVLFYAVCIAAYVTGTVGAMLIMLAWIYTVAKLAHIFIHVTRNKLLHRMPVFVFSVVLLQIMWIVFAITLFQGRF